MLIPGYVQQCLEALENAQRNEEHAAEDGYPGRSVMNAKAMNK